MSATGKQVSMAVDPDFVYDEGSRKKKIKSSVYLVRASLVEQLMVLG